LAQENVPKGKLRSELNAGTVSFDVNRELLEEKLGRIIETIESQRGLPLDVKEVYAFGSFARGKESPGDLDLIVVHQPWTEEQINDMVRGQEGPDQQMNARLKSNRESVDLVYGESLEAAVSLMPVKPSFILKLWSIDDHDWRGKASQVRLRDPVERIGILEDELASQRVYIRKLEDNVQAWQKALSDVNERYQEFSPFFTEVMKEREAAIKLIRSQNRKALVLLL
jgi:predicted nucleotidyltransferase